jgi:hypothetical protein
MGVFRKAPCRVAPPLELLGAWNLNCSTPGGQGKARPTRAGQLRVDYRRPIGGPGRMLGQMAGALTSSGSQKSERCVLVVVTTDSSGPQEPTTVARAATIRPFASSQMSRVNGLIFRSRLVARLFQCVVLPRHHDRVLYRALAVDHPRLTTRMGP